MEEDIERQTAESEIKHNLWLLQRLPAERRSPQGRACTHPCSYCKNPMQTHHTSAAQVHNVRVGLCAVFVSLCDRLLEFRYEFVSLAEMMKWISSQVSRDCVPSA